MGARVVKELTLTAARTTGTRGTAAEAGSRAVLPVAIKVIHVGAVVTSMRVPKAVRMVGRRAAVLRAWLVKKWGPRRCRGPGIVARRLGRDQP